MTKQKLAALDIGNVCISIHLGNLFKKLGFWKGLIQVPRIRKACHLMECGKMSREEFLDLLDRATGRKYTPGELIDLWNSVLGPSIPGMAEAVRNAVDRGWRFVYFSNTSALHMEHFLKTNDFCHLVTGAVFSYEAGAMKPHPRIYEIFEEKYGVPDIYFDDRQENIETALARGWNAVTFQFSDQLDQLLD